MDKICIQIPSFTKKNGTKVSAHERCYEAEPLTDSQKELLKRLEKTIGDNDNIGSSIRDPLLREAYSDAYDLIKKELGINEDIKIIFKDLKNNAGHIGLFDNAKIDRLTLSSNQSFQQGITFMMHEMKHIQQVNSGKLYTKDNDIYWDGKKHISFSDYNKLVKGINSKRKGVGFENYTKYKGLPWEAEAFGTGKKAGEISDKLLEDYTPLFTDGVGEEQKPKSLFG